MVNNVTFAFVKGTPFNDTDVDIQFGECVPFELYGYIKYEWDIFF